MIDYLICYARRYLEFSKQELERKNFPRMEDALQRVNAAHRAGEALREAAMKVIAKHQQGEQK